MPEDARVRMPEDAPAGPQPASERLKRKTVELEWYPMDAAPQDGKPVWLKSGDSTPIFQEALWRHTRAINRQTGRWEPTGFWAIRNGGGARVPFDPIGWRQIQ
jgi:hypothetical protein